MSRSQAVQAAQYQAINRGVIHIDHDSYSANINVSLSAQDLESNEAAAELSNFIVDAVHEAIEEYKDRTGITISLNISENQSQFSPRYTKEEIEDEDEDGGQMLAQDPRQLGFPFE